MGDTNSIESGATVPRPSAPSPASDDAPTGLARYQPLSTIAEGGMGRVLEAVDRQFSRVVALKQMKGAGDGGRFVQEALVTANLEHPGVPPVYERGLQEDGSPYYVMRRVRGRSLEDALTSSPGLEGRLTFLPAVTRAAHTLGFAHERGVVHRDVKPQNIMVGSHGEVFVVDWGLARVGQVPSSSDSQPSGGGSATETRAGAVMGTPGYMAPEQARGEGSLIDARTDVFALGAVLYRLISGVAPYQADSTEEALKRAAGAVYVPLARVAPDAPLPLIQICERAMASRPEERFPTAQHLADALERFSSEAVRGAHQKHAAWVAPVAGVIAVVMCPGGLTKLTDAPADAVRGPIAYFAIFFFLVSLALAWFHARSGGKLGLAPLGYAFAIASFLCGPLTFFMHVLFQFDTEAGVAPAGAATSALCSMLCIVALMSWGMVLRTRQR